jgi:hypothetical protein
MTMTDAPAAGPWQPLHPGQGRPLLGHIRARWWVAGGWALDLFIGQQSRPHKDLDIGILRRDLQHVLAAMPGWEFFAAKGGRLYGPLTGEAQQDVNSLWVRRTCTVEWAFELMLDDSDSDHWVFRRDRRIRRPLDTLVRYDSERTPYLAPEIQLLYKAARPRPEDSLDFERLSAYLDEPSRRWLFDALSQLDPQHQWLPALQRTG